METAVGVPLSREPGQAVNGIKPGSLQSKPNAFEIKVIQFKLEEIDMKFKLFETNPDRPVRQLRRISKTGLILNLYLILHFIDLIKAIRLSSMKSVENKENNTR